MITLINLGWCVARLDAVNHRLTIMSPSEETEGRYSPAESVVVNCKGNLITLRDALNEAYPREVEA